MEKNILEYKEYKKLLENPLWHLCRSNTENAISNFWAYLIQIAGNTSIILGEKFNKNIDKKDILREKFHTDILLNLEEEPVIIENKVKSLPNNEQLKEYERDIKKKKEYESKEIKKYLITPIQTKNEDPDIQYLTYDDVCKNIKTYVDKASFNEETKEIISKFVGIINSISKIILELENHYQLLGYWEDETSEDIINEMVKDKTYPLIKYANNIFLEDIEDKIFKKIKEKIAISEVGFSNNRPLISFKFKTKSNKDWLQGIQIQNKNFKYFIEGPSADEEDINEEIKQFAQEHTPDVSKFAGNKDLCKYRVKNGVFKYKYVKIEGKNHLEKLLNFFVEKIKNNTRY